MTVGSLTDSLRETLALFDGAATPLTTVEVADELGLGRRSAYDRLDRLVDSGDLETKKVGANARVWWVPAGAVSADRERELEEAQRRFRTLVENFPNGGVAQVDADLRYVTFGGTHEADTGVTSADLEGAPVRDALPPAIADVVVPRYEAALDGEAASFVDTLGDSVYQFHFLPVTDDDGDVFGVIATSQDVTDRQQAERTLEERVRQQDAVAALGECALGDSDLDALMADAATLVADTLDTDYCKVLDLDADAGELLLRQGVGWDDGVVGSATVSAVDTDSQAAYTLATERAVVVEDLATESRFSGPALLTDHGVRSGLSTVVGSTDDPWGVLGTHDTDVREFSEHDAAFVQSVANILATAVDRREYEQTLLRQREQLAATNNLNRVVREITDAVIDQSTREEIEAEVCEQLADSESYLFAWVGDVDNATQTVEPRSAAGADGYLDDVSIPVDAGDERNQGSTGRALCTGRMQVASDVGAAAEGGLGRDAVERYGVRSVASIPFVHDDAVYGVLNVYAERRNAFEGQERELLGHLGEIVGHAIAASERKQALLSDELVELDFRIEDVFDAFDVPAELPGRISFEHVVAAGDDDYVAFGAASAAGVDSLHALADVLPSWETVTVHERDEGHTFELLLTDPPVLSTVASLGGYVDSAVIEDGDYRMTVVLAPSVDVRRLVDVVEKAYPDAEMLRRRQVERARDDPKRFQRDLLEELTDRQRATLETAHHAGFFEWPREASGEDVADSLGIAGPTFHQHLRGAQKVVFDALMTE